MQRAVQQKIKKKESCSIGIAAKTNMVRKKQKREMQSKKTGREDSLKMGLDPCLGLEAARAWIHDSQTTCQKRGQHGGKVKR